MNCELNQNEGHVIGHEKQIVRMSKRLRLQHKKHKHFGYRSFYRKQHYLNKPNSTESFIMVAKIETLSEHVVLK